MKTTIIMPTIRVPQNLNAWMDLLDPENGDEVIIAGNAISPHGDINEALTAATARTGVTTTYIHPDDEGAKSFAIDAFLPPNHTNRRNLALLVAMQRRPDILITLDDDNFPYRPDWLRGVKTLLDPDVRCHRPIVSAESGWWNAGELCRPPIVHRGYPVSRWTERGTTTLMNAPDIDPRLGVVASLWYGDPDINAVERMFVDPEVTNVTGSAILAKGTWCPFDSQSTTVVSELLEMLFMWPSVGRYDDIWSSYVMRAAMDISDWYITYGTPAVQQERNPHNLIKDLRDELHGYEYTEQFTDFLRLAVQRFAAEGRQATEPYEVFRWLMLEIATGIGEPVVPSFTRDSLLAWLTDCDQVRLETGLI